MSTTAPVDPEAAAASPLLPWNAKVQKFSAMYSLYSNGLRGWGYLLNLLCVLTGAATGDAALAHAKMFLHSYTAGPIPDGGTVNTCLSLLES